MSDGRRWLARFRSSWRLAGDAQRVRELAAQVESDRAIQLAIQAELQHNPNGRQDRDYTLALWSQYEEVAVHFNDLIMRWRLQAIGGLAALITAAGFVVADVTCDTRYRAMLLLSTVLFFGWIAVACIDLFYYRRLLAGAVESLLALERRTPDIRLSTDIERAAKRGGELAPRVFYGFGLLPIIVLIVWAGYNLVSDRPCEENDEARAPASVIISAPPGR